MKKNWCVITLPCLLNAAKSSSNLSNSLHTFSIRDFSGSDAEAAARRPWLIMFLTADSPKNKSTGIRKIGRKLFLVENKNFPMHLQ